MVIIIYCTSYHAHTLQYNTCFIHSRVLLSLTQVYDIVYIKFHRSIVDVTIKNCMEKLPFMFELVEIPGCHEYNHHSYVHT